MNYNFLNHYAYLLIGIMKKSLHKSNSDYFYLEDFDLCRLKIKKEDAISTLNVFELKKVLWYIRETRAIQEIEKSKPPTYFEMRSIFKKDFTIICERT